MVGRACRARGLPRWGPQRRASGERLEGAPQDRYGDAQSPSTCLFWPALCRPRRVLLVLSMRPPSSPLATCLVAPPPAAHLSPPARSVAHVDGLLAAPVPYPLALRPCLGLRLHPLPRSASRGARGALAASRNDARAPCRRRACAPPWPAATLSPLLIVALPPSCPAWGPPSGALRRSVPRARAASAQRDVPALPALRGLLASSADPLFAARPVPLLPRPDFLRRASTLPEQDTRRLLAPCVLLA